MDIIRQINEAMRPTDLNIPNSMRLEEHKIWLGYLINIRQRSGWYIGALITAGQTEHGEMYSQVLSETGLSYATVSNCVSVYKKVESSRRNKTLSFAHHAEVAKLSPTDQTKWLDKAQNECLTRAQLRGAIKRDHGEKTPEKGRDIELFLSEIAKSINTCIDLINDVAMQK